jgi:hypothetical protein
MSGQPNNQLNANNPLLDFTLLTPSNIVHTYIMY